MIGGPVSGLRSDQPRYPVVTARARVTVCLRVYALLVLLLAAWSGTASASAADSVEPQPTAAPFDLAPEAIGSGLVEAVEYASMTLIIEGYRYRTAPDLRVEQGGAAADIATLVPGTKVQFRYLRHPQGLPEVIAIRVVPDGYEIRRR